MLRMAFRQVTQQSLEGISRFAMASNYQAYRSIGSRAVERNHLVIHRGDHIIDELLVIFDCRLQESEYRVVGETELTRFRWSGIMRFRHDTLPGTKLKGTFHL
jgi:hypothetical protein